MNTSIKKHVQVNAPFSLLYETHLPLFLEHGINPEIGFDAHSLDTYDTSHFASVAERLQEAGLQVTLHGPFLDLSPGSPDPGVRDWTRHRLAQTLKAVECLQPCTLVCHAAYESRRYRDIRGLWIEKSLKTWTWLAGELGKTDCRLMLENTFEDHPRDITSLFEGLAGLGVGFCLDIGHQAAFGTAPVESWLETLGPYLGQIHLHDNHGTGDEHLAPGKGSIDFFSLFEQLGAWGREPPVMTLEPHREEDLWPGLQFLEKVWPWRS